eukprot:1085019-Amphidinium_carterae.1
MSLRNWACTHFVALGTLFTSSRNQFTPRLRSTVDSAGFKRKRVQLTQPVANGKELLPPRTARRQPKTRLPKSRDTLFADIYRLARSCTKSDDASKILESLTTKRK